MPNKELNKLKNVGPATVAQLNNLGIQSIQDLCFHLPINYQDKTKIMQISDIDVGDEAFVEGKILSVQTIYKPRKMLVAKISNGSSFFNLRLFYFHPNQSKQFRSGAHIRCFGKTSLSRYGLEMIHPDYQIMQNITPLSKTLNPVYRITKGISQNKMRSLIRLAMDDYNFEDEEIDLSRFYNDESLTIREALNIIHAPDPTIPIDELTPGGTHPARVKLLKEELIAFQIGMVSIKNKQKTSKAYECKNNGKWENDFKHTFPFELTNAQKRVSREINNDIAETSPMMRLVQGDVGSGKTAVALLSATKALDSGYQVVFMAPTTLLAQQHLESIKNYFPSHQDEIALLTSGLRKKERDEIIENIFSGSIKFLVGTHAVLQNDVNFKALAMVIIDEQHRFGVNQRLTLTRKADNGLSAHQLTLTATPIPRTLSMSIYANMDVSVIDELPPGRLPIQTSMVAISARDKLIKRVEKAIKKDSLVYWICPLVEESETLDLSSVNERFDTLKESLGEKNVALMHGKLSNREKKEAIYKFKSGEIKILISTTVIEVGVDVPDADIMIIENAERFGLAQLHQLRGRVGRGSKASFCILLHKDKLTELSQERLSALCDSNDGFAIAEKDLEIRGPGEILGSQQTGVLPFRYANLVRDNKYLTDTKNIAERIYDADKEKANQLMKRWISGIISYANA